MSRLDAAKGVKYPFAPVQGADEPIGSSLAPEGLRSSAANGSGHGAAYCESSAIRASKQSRSCFHWTLSGDRADRRTMIAWPRCSAANASLPFDTFERIRGRCVRHREIALPAGVAGIGLRQAVSDRGAIGKGLERAGEVALRDLHVADFVLRTPRDRAASRRCRDRIWPGGRRSQDHRDRR